MKFGLLTLLFFYFSAASAKNQLLYFGGGGESKDKLETIFAKGFNHTIDFAQKRKWDAEYYSTHDHLADKAVAYYKHVKTKEFTVENIQKRFELLDQQIKNGEYKSGDQLLIMFDTHGTVDDSYLISTTDDKLFNPEVYLRRIVTEAEKQGIKIGIMGLTCFSGQLQNFGSDKTCVVSVSQADQLGYVYDSETFAKNLITSNNLEDVFTKGRTANRWALAQPEISSPAGQKTQAALKALKSYLGDPKNAVNEAMKNDTCTSYEQKIQQLDNSLTRIENFAFFSWSKKLITEEEKHELSKLLKFHEEARVNLADSLPKPGAAFPSCINNPDPAPGQADEKLCLKSVTDALNTKEFYKAQVRILAKSKAPKEQVAKWQQALEAIDSAVKKYSDTEKEEDAQRTLKLKGAIESLHLYERQLYDKLYKRYSAESEDQPNPCRDFKL